MDWKKLIIDSNETLKEAIRRIDSLGGQGVVVVDAEGRLVGTITDGDVRRAFLRGVSVESSVVNAVFHHPTRVLEGTPRSEIETIANEKSLDLIPIVSDSGEVVDIFFESQDREDKEIPVVLMAGGLGTRLGDLTKECPKPMLKVGGRPILERIIENFKMYGFKNFYISVNYKAEMIMDHFKDGSDFCVDIKYLQEKERLGTAGSLSLLPDLPEGPVVISNGDLLTGLDLESLMSFHKEKSGKFTTCVRKYDLQVPFGVVSVENEKIQSLCEKPKHSFLVNAGIYVIDSGLLSMVPQNRCFDMTELIEKLLEENIDLNAFLIHEEWLDVGRPQDLHNARSNVEDKDV